MANDNKIKSEELLKEYAAGKYLEVTSSCTQATNKMIKGLNNIAENTEKDNTPEQILENI